jgi:hypothetical protein
VRGVGHDPRRGEALTGIPDLLRGSSRTAGASTIAAGSQDGVDEFQRILREAGVSLTELDQIARDHGITLLDDEGRILASAFQALIPVLNDAILQLTTFGTSLTDQRAIAEPRSALAGIDAGDTARRWSGNEKSCSRA